MQSIVAAHYAAFCVWPSPRASALLRCLTRPRPCRWLWKKISQRCRMISRKRFKPAVRPDTMAPVLPTTTVLPTITTAVAITIIAGAAVGTAGGTEGVASAAGGSER